MPVSPTPDESYYWEIALAYRDAELAMLEQIKNRLLKGQTLDDQAWATARLAEIQTLRRENTAVLRAVNTSMASKIAGSMGNAYKDGELSALKDTKAFLPERPSAITSQARRASVAAIAREVAGGVATASSGVLRQAEDKYREVVQRVVTSTATGAVDRRTATDQALKAALGAGLKTGPDSRMSLESYIEMATRTGVAKAMIEGHTEAMAANGIDLVYIHPGPRACEICDIWGNTVLWREGGPTGMVIVESMVGDGTVEVHVSGTLPQARGAGWGHPNCRCSVGAYIPGATELPVNRPPWDQEGYEAQQRQREIERHIRDWKRKAALATDPESLAKAQRKVEQWQAAQRAHMESYSFLKRQYGREGGGGYRSNRRTIASPQGRDFRSMSDADRLEAARVMYGEGSPQYREAQRKYGGSVSTGAPPLRDVAEGKATFTSVYEGRQFGKYHLEVEGHDSGSVATMKVVDSKGNRVGSVTRTFGRDNNGDWYVYHDLMQLDPDARGQGFSTQFSQFSEDWYRESGIAYIRVHAALENGPYAWARAGYAWDADRYQPDLFSGKSEPPRISSRLKQLQLDLEMGLNPEIAKYAYPGLDVDAIDRAKLDKWVEAFDSGDMASWPTPQDLVNDPTGAALFRTPVGVDWYGRKDLK